MIPHRPQTKHQIAAQDEAASMERTTGPETRSDAEQNKRDLTKKKDAEREWITMKSSVTASLKFWQQDVTAGWRRAAGLEERGYRKYPTRGAPIR